MKAMKNYSKEEILERVKSLSSFKRIPGDYWLVGIRSKEDTYNKFDDRFYLFKNEELILSTTGTTNAGSKGLLEFYTYNSEGCAIVKADEWYYNLWKPGLHKGKMRALRQSTEIKFFRDNNKNFKAEEIGTVKKELIGINFHAASYQIDDRTIELINGWSTGCQVCNNIKDYYRIIDTLGKQGDVSYCLLKEW